LTFYPCDIKDSGNDSWFDIDAFLFSKQNHLYLQWSWSQKVVALPKQSK